MADAETIERLLDRHLAKITRLTQLLADNKVDSEEKYDKFKEAIIATSVALDAAKQALKAEKQSIY